MTIVLEDQHVAELLSMEACIDAMETAFADFARGAVNLPRIRYRSPTLNAAVTYGSNVHIGTTPSFDVAAIRIGGRPTFTANAGFGSPSAAVGAERNWGFICILSMATGEPLAFIQEFYLSGLRVGATSALAAKYLAKPGATTLGMLGSGKLARTNLEGLAKVRPIRRVKVYSPTRAHREAYAREMSAKLEIEVTPVDDPRGVVGGADVVCCATNAGYVSGEPVLHGDWLEGGQLVISLQNSDADFKKSEVDDATLARSTFICINDKESVFSNGQRELLDPIEAGVTSWDRVHLLGDVVIGAAKPDGAQPGVVYYKNNTGMGIQMSAAGAVIVRNAVERGVGHHIPSEWFGSDLSSWTERGFSPSP